MLLIACIIIGYLLLTLSFLIPSEAMHGNAVSSVEIFSSEESWQYDKYSGRILDNYTDSIMLLTAAWPGNEGAFDKAVEAYRIDGEPMPTFVSYYKGELKDINTATYSRYWHGYLVFLRPVFVLLSYGNIRTVNTVIQLLLLLAVMYLMLKKAPECLVPFAVMILLMGPAAMGKSLQFSSVYYVMLTAVLVILILPENFPESKAAYLFLLSGAATSYLDLLTAPTVTLTVPLCLLCVRLGRKGKLKSTVRLIAECAAVWFAAYAIMWAAKWIIAIISEGRGSFELLRDKIIFRASTSNNESSFSRLDAIIKNFDMLFKVKYLTAGTVLVFIFTVLLVIVRRKEIDKKSCAFALTLLVIAVIPLVWIFVLSNHSYIHSVFTFRTLCPVVFVFLTAMNCLIPETFRPERYGFKAK